MSFLLRLFLIFVIAYSIYSIIMFVIRLLSNQSQKHFSRFHNRHFNQWKSKDQNEHDKVIELNKDQYKVE
ncbi:MAG: hypothetical protein N2316_04190 [Spirochaetes bacterium]|nr:hypothetical protein [Spirochaetota bacterium]